MERIIERTDDGSTTLFVPALNEHYHSVKGARTESQHIFIDRGLNASEAAEPRILEIGFGTGLNALLTLEATEKNHRKIHYTGVELYPLPWDTVEKLGYSDHPLFKALHTTPWETEVNVTPYFTLRKLKEDITAPTNHLSQATDSGYDLVYFDAFAPEKQPEMWSQELFSRIYVIMNKGGILTTYCAKGTVRRMLQSSGFVVERLPGPPGGKREILRAQKTLK